MEENFQEEDIIEDIYIDDGQSGTDYDRPEFQRMLCDVERGKVNCIVCKNLSRAFRNYSDQGYFLESYFPKFHTRFVTLGDPKVDTFTDPEVVSGMEVPISGLMNDRFACKTSNDIRRTFDTKRRRGEFIGAFAPYGYLKDPEDKNHLIIDPDAAEVVRDIFCWYVYGDMKMEKEKEERFRGNMSKEGIARRLNDLGIPNPTAYKRRQGLKYCNPQIEKMMDFGRGLVLQQFSPMKCILELWFRENKEWSAIRYMTESECQKESGIEYGIPMRPLSRRRCLL